MQWDKHGPGPMNLRDRCLRQLIVAYTIAKHFTSPLVYVSGEAPQRPPEVDMPWCMIMRHVLYKRGDCLQCGKLHYCS